jgi:hypothetical protein
MEPRTRPRDDVFVEASGANDQEGIASVVI